jgi:hypothetical protein
VLSLELLQFWLGDRVQLKGISTSLVSHLGQAGCVHDLIGLVAPETLRLVTILETVLLHRHE